MNYALRVVSSGEPAIVTTFPGYEFSDLLGKKTRLSPSYLWLDSSTASSQPCRIDSSARINRIHRLPCSAVGLHSAFRDNLAP
jgi:hypothetical protein